MIFLGFDEETLTKEEKERMSIEFKESWFSELWYAIKRSITKRFAEINDPLAKVDLNGLVQDILANDPEVKERLRARVRRFLLDEIDNVDSLDELDYNQDFRFREHLTGQSSLTAIVANLLQEELADKFKTGIRNLLTTAIEELDQDDIFEDEESWQDMLTRIGLSDFMPNLIKQLLTENPEAVQTGIRNLLTTAIEELDQDDIFEENESWQDMLTRIDLPDSMTNLVRHLLTENPETVQKLQDAVLDQLKDKIDEISGSDVLSDDFWEDFNDNFDLTRVLKDALANPEVIKVIGDKLIEALTAVFSHDTEKE